MGTGGSTIAQTPPPPLQPARERVRPHQFHSELIFALRRLGDRLERTGKERIAVTGTIVRGT